MSTAGKSHDDAVVKATDLFWEKGFHATSMRNLQEAINLRPGSIYASFGSKEGLFKRALNEYAQRSRKQLGEAIKQAGNPLEGLKSFIKQVVQCQHEAPSNMCLLVKSISELTDDQAELLSEAKRLLNAMELAFADAIAEAQSLGLVNLSENPAKLAQRVQMQFMGLRAYVRAHGNTDEASTLVDDMFQQLFPEVN